MFIFLSWLKSDPKLYRFIYIIFNQIPIFYHYSLKFWLLKLWLLAISKIYGSTLIKHFISLPEKVPLLYLYFWFGCNLMRCPNTLSNTNILWFLFKVLIAKTLTISHIAHLWLSSYETLDQLTRKSPTIIFIFVVWLQSKDKPYNIFNQVLIFSVFSLKFW